jgi:hypothetical protein
MMKDIRPLLCDACLAQWMRLPPLMRNGNSMSAGDPHDFFCGRCADKLERLLTAKASPRDEE